MSEKWTKENMQRLNEAILAMRLGIIQLREDTRLLDPHKRVEVVGGSPRRYGR